MPNPSRVRLRARVHAFAKSIPGGSAVLDVGAGSGPFARHFENHEYRSSDFRQNAAGDIDFVGDMAQINVESQSFNAILCTQALHAHREPAAVLSEFARILKPGGQVLITSVFAYEPVDEPYDCFRITPHGLKSLLETSSLVLERYENIEGYLGTLAYQCAYAWRSLPSTYLPLRLIFYVLARFLSYLELKNPLPDSIGYPKNYAFYLTKLDSRLANNNALQK